MRSQISGLGVALRNSQNGISLLQVAEGALEQTNSMLQRMRELSVQASNDSLTSQDRQYIQLEVDELKKQIDRIADTTQFNRKRILDGSSGALWASSASGVKVRVNGGLTHTDQFGQKVSSEGNYRLEVKAEAGLNQVRKSNIVNVATTVHLVHEININNGLDNSPEIKSEGEGWKFENGLLTISKSGTYNIVGTGDITTNRMRVDSDVEADIFLTNVNIDTSSIDTSNNPSYAVLIRPNAKINLYLEGNNYLKGRSGIRVRDDATLNIANAGESEGTLQAIADSEHTGAGIGGGSSGTGATGNITIFSGNIVAKGGLFSGRYR